MAHEIAAKSCRGEGRKQKADLNPKDKGWSVGYSVWRVGGQPCRWATSTEVTLHGILNHRDEWTVYSVTEGG